MKAQYQNYIGNNQSTDLVKSEILNNVFLLNGMSDRSEVEFLQNSVNEFCPDQRGLKALALGARRGVSAMALAKMGFTVSAFDMYTNSIPTLQQLALQQELNISFGKGGSEQIQISNKKFDLIHETEFLSDTPSEMDRMLHLENLKNALLPDGKLVLTVKVLSNDYDPADSFESLRLDEDFILWRQTPASDLPGVVELNGKHWTAQKRIAPLNLVREEIMAAGLTILSGELEVIPGQPSVLRLVLTGAQERL